MKKNGSKRAGPWDDRRFVLSRDFCLGFDDTGRPVFFQLAEPHAKVRGDADLPRFVMGFARPGGATVEAARVALDRTSSSKRTARDEWVDRWVGRLVSRGVLVPTAAPTPLYDAGMAKDYREHRKVAEEVVELLGDEAAIGASTRVLDLATGTGGLAIGLARRSRAVTGIDLSLPFLREARKGAREAGVRVRFVHGSCDRLLLHTLKYDVVTISQAYHWLDPVIATRGIYNVLEPGGRLFVINSFTEFVEAHPLRKLAPEAYPPEKRTPEEQLEFRIRKYRRILFAARSHGRVLRPEAGWLLSIPGSFPLGFANAFFTRTMGANNASGVIRDRWAQLVELYGKAAPHELAGTQHWFVMAFRDGPGPASRAD